jgi:hypothetical protein
MVPEACSDFDFGFGSVHPFCQGLDFLDLRFRRTDGRVDFNVLHFRNHRAFVNKVAFIDRHLADRTHDGNRDHELPAQPRASALLDELPDVPALDRPRLHRYAAALLQDDKNHGSRGNGEDDYQVFLLHLFPPAMLPEY